MSADPTRASDSERERVVARLRDAAAGGRLSVDELDERSATAYAAVTRGELAALIDDLPVPRREAAPRPRPRPGRRLPRMPGRSSFRVSWRGPANPRRAGSDIMELLVPVFFSFGYHVADRTSDRLVLERRYQPGWTILLAVLVFPIGLVALLARGTETVTIDLMAREDHTLTIVQGVAPLRLRRALADLES